MLQPLSLSLSLSFLLSYVSLSSLLVPRFIVLTVLAHSFFHGVQSIPLLTPRASQTLAERTQRIDPRPVESLVCIAADGGVFALL